MIVSLQAIFFTTVTILDLNNSHHLRRRNISSFSCHDPEDQNEDHSDVFKFSRNWIVFKKTFREQGFFDNFCSISRVFHCFFNFWLNFIAPTRRSWLHFDRLDFMTPWRPGGSSIVEWNKFWSFRPLCYWVNWNNVKPNNWNKVKPYYVVWNSTNGTVTAEKKF